MKKIFFLLAAISMFQVAIARDLTIRFKNSDREYACNYISCTEDSLCVADLTTGMQMSIPANKIAGLICENRSKVIVKLVDGKLSVAPNPRYEKAQEVKTQNRQSATDPNLVVANAMKKSGAFSLGVGVPMLAVGTILVGYGYGAGEVSHGVKVHTQAQSNCQTAGLVLMGVGGGMTLVGIPLYSYGKKALEIQIKAQAAGAGIALSF